jgi:hypothetical protein
MRFHFKPWAGGVLAPLLIVMFTLAPNMVADSHVVSSADLQKQTIATSRERQQNIEDVQRFLSTPVAQNALKTAKVDSEQIKTAVAQLDNTELAQMASRARKAQADFAAGTLSDRDLVLIILGLVALILIIVAVR